MKEKEKISLPLSSVRFMKTSCPFVIMLGSDNNGIPVISKLMTSKGMKITINFPILMGKYFDGRFYMKISTDRNVSSH